MAGMSFDEAPRIHLGSLLRSGSDVSAEGHVQALHYHQGNQAETLEFAEPAEYEVTVNALQGNEFWLQGQLDAVLKMECARCLRPVQVPLSLKLGTLMRFDPATAEPYLEEADTGEELLVFGDPDLDLSGYLAESVLLQAPLSVLHDPACKGLCQACGHDLNEPGCGLTGGQPCLHAQVPIETIDERNLEADHAGSQHARQNPFAALQGLDLPDE